MGKKKIFLGLDNIASQLGDLKQAFYVIGHDSLVMTSMPDSRAKREDSDVNLYRLKNKMGYFKPGAVSTRLKPLWNKCIDWYGWKKAVSECDVFIFMWKSFRPDFSDYAELKKSGKKIITVFVGEDARWHYAMKQEFEKDGYRPIGYDADFDYSVTGLKQRLLRLRMAEKYSDFIFSRLDQSQLSLRPYYRWNMMAIPENIPHKPQQREKNVVVAHAPTSRTAKGTKYVLEVFERLKQEGISFTQQLIENVPPSKAMELYAEADILIDQLLCPGTGKLSTEALSAGTIVMSLMRYKDYPQKNPIECPIIDVNPDTLYERLKELILDYNFRKEHALKGRPFVEKHLHVNLFAEKVVKLLNGEKLDYDYYPAFFRDEFIPESKEALEIYNQWTKEVQHCAWYAQYVKPGERNGLHF